MNRRFRILMYWLFKNKNGVSFTSLFAFLFDQVCTKKALKKINSTEENSQYYEVILKGEDRKLFFPRDISLYHLYMVITESLYSNDWHYYEEKETKVSKNDIVLDCGSAEGLFTLISAKKCKKVYAIEPNPIFIDSLKKTFSQAPNVEILEFALSDIPSIQKIDNSGISSILNADVGIDVNVESIDRLFKDKPFTYIKADIEGFEMNMLRGAKETIQLNKPKIAITTYHNKKDAMEISEYLRSIVPEYNIKIKGIDSRFGCPVMLHAWV